AVVLRNDLRVLRALPAMLDSALEGTEGLGPLAVLAAVPEEERAVRRARDRHGAPARGAHTLSERLAVLELLAGVMARRAGDTPVRAQARVEEEALAERRGARIAGPAIGRIGRRRL